MKFYAINVAERHCDGWPLKKKILLVMKLTTLLLVIALLQVSAKGFSQITVTGSNVPAETVMKVIEKQTGYVFIYDEVKVKLGIVSVDLHNASITETLNQLFKNLPITYQIIKKNIVLQPKTEPPVRQEVKPSASQSISVSGKVVDELNKPLPGVTVRQKGTNNATITDAKGSYSILLPDDKGIIVFTYVGFESQELQAKYIPNASVIILKAAATNLTEVVVNKGYYNTSKAFNTGDISSVSGKEIEQAPVTNVLAAIEGRVPGMFITQYSGLPGSGYNVQIRGQNSITNGNDPLYVIDGVPYSSQLLPNQTPGGGNPLNFINPTDIQSIDVLKDADATAIYGSRGANGVVIITTKKGKAGNAQVSINLYSGVGQVGHMESLLNTPQYLEMRNEALKNDGVSPSLDNGDYDLLQWDTTRYTNWQKALIGGTAHYSDAQASISGGNVNTQYIIGGEYHRETTVFPGDFSDVKGSVHFNLTSSSDNQKFKIQFSGNYVSDDDKLPLFDPTSEINHLAPDAPTVYNSDGSLNWAPNSSGGSTWVNPFAFLLNKYTAVTNNLITNAVLSYQILPNLLIKTSLGYNNLQMTETGYQPIAAGDPSIPNYTGFASFTNNKSDSWIVEPQLNYQTRVAKNDLNVLIGATIQENNTDGQILNGTGYTTDALIQSIEGATQITPNSVVNSTYKYSALYGRLNYNIDDKYLLNLTGRRDGSSRFGPANQFANFWAVGTGWLFSKETFIQNAIPSLSFGKIRASYGTSGNDQIGDYRFLDTYSALSNPYANTVGLIPTNLFNPNLAWEINKKLEAGFELGFIGDRILLTASYFLNRSSNELINAPLPSITGFSSIAENLPAVVQNKGWEFTLNTVNFKNSNFKWTTSFNLTANSNKLLSFPNLATSTYANILAIGQPLDIQKVIKYAGINPTTGIYEFYAANGSITSNPDPNNDRTSFVNINPKFYGGFQNNFQYQNFELTIFFQFVKQTGYNVLYGASAPPGFEGQNQFTAVLNRWQAPGDKAKTEQFTETYADAYNAYSILSDYYSNASFTDASYVKLKNATISYNLPKSFIEHLQLQSCRIYFQGENLLTISNHYLGFDPETQSSTGLPPLRVLTVGLQAIIK